MKPRWEFKIVVWTDRYYPHSKWYKTYYRPRFWPFWGYIDYFRTEEEARKNCNLYANQLLRRWEDRQQSKRTIKLGWLP